VCTTRSPRVRHTGRVQDSVHTDATSVHNTCVACTRPIAGPGQRRTNVRPAGLSPPGRDMLVIHCRTTNASTAPCKSRRACCPARGASYCAPCQPLLQAISGWIRSSPSTPGRDSVYTTHWSWQESLSDTNASAEGGHGSPTFVHRLCATTDHPGNSQTESCTVRYSSRLKYNYCSYSRLIDFGITQF
jgi:hypothetical protein